MTNATPTKARAGHPLNTEATGRIVGGQGQTFRGGGAGDRSIGDAGADFIVGGGNGNTTNLGTSATDRGNDSSSHSSNGTTCDRGNPTNLDGGAGDDRIIAQGSDDTMTGGGDDGMQGDRGNHGGPGNGSATTIDRGNPSSLDGGAGDRHDLYQFSVGDGHDTFEGGAGGTGVFLCGGADTDVAFTLSPGTTLERVHEGWRVNGEGNGMLTLPDGSTLTFTGVSYIGIRGPETFETRD